MAARPSPMPQTLLAHLSFFATVGLMAIALGGTRGITHPAARWLIVHAPFWIWLVVAVRFSPRPIRIALMIWTAVSIVAAGVAGPLADLTVVPRVVWVIGELGLVLHFLVEVLTEHAQPALATLSEVLSQIAIVAAVTTGITWFFARGAYETSIRVIEHGDVRHLVHGSIGALIGVVASTALIRAWFATCTAPRYEDGTVLAA